MTIIIIIIDLIIALLNEGNILSITAYLQYVLHQINKLYATQWLLKFKYQCGVTCQVWRHHIVMGGIIHVYIDL